MILYQQILNGYQLISSLNNKVYEYVNLKYNTKAIQILTMILRPHSQQMFKPYRHDNAIVMSALQMRKKIQNFSFLPQDKIGRGYSSIVYKGQNDLTIQPVAIKIIELKSLKDQNTKKFLQNELECLRRLNHENTLRYINSFMTSNNCYIITQLYSRGDLAKQLKQANRFSEAKVFSIFTQFYKGYCHFHSRGYIHRDIKPSNVLISQTGSYVIADFGFVKKTSQNAQDTFNVGTPVYMAPQSLTNNIYTQKSDIWSMGIMLFELIYGFLPFHSRDEADLKRQVCTKQIKLAMIQQNTLIYTSSEFKSLLTNCLRKNPENRIHLHQIENHPWFKKFTPGIISANLSFPQFIKEPTYSIGNDFEKEKTNNYGYIGNLAIKRQKSLQGGPGFSLRNHYKNSDRKQSIGRNTLKEIKTPSYQQDKQNISMNIVSIRQKFKQLDQFVDKSHERIRNMNYFKISSENCINQNKMDIILNQKNSDSQINVSVGKLLKKSFEYSNTPKLQIKKVKLSQNPHSDRINDENFLKIKISKTSGNNNNDTNSIQKRQKNVLIIQQRQKAYSMRSNGSITSKISQSTDSKTRPSLIQGLKNIIQLKNDQIIGKSRQQNLKYQVVSDMKQSKQYKFIKPKTQQINWGKQSPCISLSNNRSELILSDKSKLINQLNQYPNHKIERPLSLQISNNQFFIRALHLLRFFFEIIQEKTYIQTNISQKVLQCKQIISRFFAIFLKKLVFTIDNISQNIFKLQKWHEFSKQQKFTTFVQVINKYYTKFSQNKSINKHLKDQYLDFSFYQVSINFSQLVLLQSQLLKSVESLKGKPQNQSQGLNSNMNDQIKIIFFTHKCLDSIISIIEKGERTFFQKNNPNEYLEVFNSRSKDPYRIPKMMIELKKKLMIMESSRDKQKYLNNKPQLFYQINTVY